MKKMRQKRDARPGLPSMELGSDHHATHAELVASKAALLAANQELASLNVQIRETLAHQQRTSDDLLNVLYSTDVATLFLDRELRIRFFTPATRSLFNIIPSDVGRPLTDLASLASGGALRTDATLVLQTQSGIDREIEAPNGTWFVRRILPYRAHDARIEGVVITYTDITERQQVARALEAARLQSELANKAKSRFLAAASHDLRQPLQTLKLLLGLLARMVDGLEAQSLIARFDDMLHGMSGMLSTLLDINQIEAGVVAAAPVRFHVNDILDRVRAEFTVVAQEKGLSLHVLSCNATIDSDPRLLEQMVRNLLSNALKYTIVGRVLLGCRRQPSGLRIEIWDSGIGIPASEFHAIFEEFHQLGNGARGRGHGLGLGLSIVQRLGKLLNHRVGVRSWLGRGSVFSIEIGQPDNTASADMLPEHAAVAVEAPVLKKHKNAVILVVEDDPDTRQLLELALRAEGYTPVTAADGNEAYDLVSRGNVQPDLMLADYNLPNGPNGLQLAVSMRDMLGTNFPVIMLTGDISSSTLRDVAREGWLQLNKPVSLEVLAQTIRQHLPNDTNPVETRESDPPGSAAIRKPAVFVVDDDPALCAALQAVLEEDGRFASTFPTGESFMDTYRPGRDECVLIDAGLPGISGLDLLRRLRAGGRNVPVVMMTGKSEMPLVVAAMKAGASDFIEKPIGTAELLAIVARALEQSGDSSKAAIWRAESAAHVAGLTPRQRQIMTMVLAGHPSKNIAADLDISQRTVENHRASIMRKTGCASLPALARLALAAASVPA